MNRAYHFATGARESWGHWFSGVLKGPTERTAANSIFLERVLPQDEFLERLRSEKRRVDRSRAPLSLALFVLGEELIRDAKKLRGFCSRPKTSRKVLPWIGEMSLVDRHPPVPCQVEKYKPRHLRRILEAKPGITDLWQAEGRSRTSSDDMVRLDIHYTQNRSLRLDFMFIIRTSPLQGDLD
jgi:hypothetical protein